MWSSSMMWCWWCSLCLNWTNRHDHRSSRNWSQIIIQRSLQCFDFIPSFTDWVCLFSWLCLSSSFPAVIVIIVEFAVFAAPTVILLQIICARRAGECLRWFTLIFNLYVYCQCLMLTVCTKGLRVTQFQFSVCMCCTCGIIDNKADLTWLDNLRAQ